MTQKIFLFAGEKSGDLLGQSLIQSLTKLDSNYEFVGVGGSEMRSEEFECVIPMEEFQMMGFSDVILSLRKIFKQFRQVRDIILDIHPEVVVLIDYPGFNLRMAKALRKKGYAGQIVQYVSPTVWAWGKKRIKQMSETLDLLLTVFPFENEYFKGTSLKVSYVGNPTKELLVNHQYQDNWKELFGIPETDHFVSLFPGSREFEVERNLSLQMEVAQMIKKQHPDACFGISCAHETIIPTMERILEKNGLLLNRDVFLLPKTYAFELMRDSQTAIAKSGTVTLELALHQRPTVVMYKVSPFNRFVAKYLLRLKLPHYCIVNILGGKSVFPELIAEIVNKKNLFQKFQEMHIDGDKRVDCIEGCKQINESLKQSHASERAAEEIQALLT